MTAFREVQEYHLREQAPVIQTVEEVHFPRALRFEKPGLWRYHNLTSFMLDYQDLRFLGNHLFLFWKLGLYLLFYSSLIFCHFVLM